MRYVGFGVLGCLFYSSVGSYVPTYVCLTHIKECSTKHLEHSVLRLGQHL